MRIGATLVTLLTTFASCDAFVENLYCGQENCYEGKLKFCGNLAQISLTNIIARG